jgi:prepilin-type N-terminal cleavage/methylation domain-containing protein
MNINIKAKSAAGRGAFSLLEVMFAVVIIAVVFVSLFLGISQGFGVVQVSRENLRATQIMQEQVEILRILNWDQITTNGSVWGFTNTFYPANFTNQGVAYVGTIQLTNAPISSTYAADVRLAIVSLSWKSGALLRRRELRTLVSHYGLHNYFLRP